jgi:hypothetical protein
MVFGGCFAIWIMGASPILAILTSLRCHLSFALEPYFLEATCCNCDKENKSGAVVFLGRINYFLGVKNDEQKRKIIKVS